MIDRHSTSLLFAAFQYEREMEKLLFDQVSKGGSRIMFRRGCTTKKLLQSRLMFFLFCFLFCFCLFCKILLILDSRRSSQGGGVRTPCTPPLDMPLGCLPFVGTGRQDPDHFVCKCNLSISSFELEELIMTTLVILPEQEHFG